MTTVHCRHFVIDAFTDKRFGGNAAAVCVLDAFVADDMLRAIARENNLSETAFLVRGSPHWHLRWLTPEVEVDLCGHATLASAHAIFSVLEPSSSSVSFMTKSGVLTVTRENDGRYRMNLPSYTCAPVAITSAMTDAMGAAPREAFAGRDLVVVYDSADHVRALRPDFAQLRALPFRCVNPTARGGGVDADVDFVSRFFAPREGIDEDPVTGSAHCTLGPLWSARLGKSTLRARQVSARTGELDVVVHAASADGSARVDLIGSAVTVVSGTMTVG